MMFWWEEQGLDHSRQMLVNELQFLGADFNRSLLTSHPMEFASDLSQRFYQISFEWTGIVDLIQWVTPVPRAGHFVVMSWRQHRKRQLHGAQVALTR